MGSNNWDNPRLVKCHTLTLFLMHRAGLHDCDVPRMDRTASSTCATALSIFTELAQVSRPLKLYKHVRHEQNVNLLHLVYN